MTDTATIAETRPVDNQRIMYVCTECADAMPECCGHYDASDLVVMPDGRWLCESCFDDERWGLCADEDSGPPSWSDMPHPPIYGPAILDERDRLTASLAAEREAREMAERNVERLIDAQRQPSLLYQGAEEYLCECGAAGSGEGHADWCPFEASEWKRWGSAFDRAEAAEAEIARREQAVADERGVWPDVIAPSKYENAAPGWEDPRLPDFRDIWRLAREIGYSVGIHGSLKRDVDLIAAPWVEDAATASALVQHLCAGLNAKQIGCLEPKPCGRVATTLQIDGWFKPIDLSIMPPAQERAQ